MLSPNEAWKTEGIPNWILAAPKLVKPYGPIPYVLPHSFGLGFKAGVLVADRDFCEKLKPGYRQN